MEGEVVAPAVGADLVAAAIAAAAAAEALWCPAAATGRQAAIAAATMVAITVATMAGATVMAIMAVTMGGLITAAIGDGLFTGVIVGRRIPTILLMAGAIRIMAATTGPQAIRVRMLPILDPVTPQPATGRLQPRPRL